MNDHEGRESASGQEMGNNEFSWSGLRYAPQEAGKLFKFDFTSQASQQLQIFTRSPYITIMLQKISQKSTIFFIFDSS